MPQFHVLGEDTKVEEDTKLKRTAAQPWQYSFRRLEGGLVSADLRQRHANFTLLM